MKMQTLRIATRKSPLAMWQAEHVKHALEKAHPDLKVELLGMLTQGDKLLATPLAEIGGKGLFVKELEKAILENRADIAVHSIKDMPMELLDGMTLAVCCEREDPRDAFVSNDYATLEALPEGAIVGTSSVRRQVQIKALRPDLDLQNLRGNVNTRLRKLDEENYDAIILAAAGLKRLGLQDRIKIHFEPSQCLPAVGQGALGIEYRADDKRIEALLTPLHHEPTHTCVQAERAVSRALEGGCQLPIAAHAIIDNNQLTLTALVGQLDGTVIIQDTLTGTPTEATTLGKTLAEKLLAQGADKLLAKIRNPE